MKKFLYSTTALVAATMIASAAFADGIPAKKSGAAMTGKQVKATSQMQAQSSSVAAAASKFTVNVGGFANWYLGFGDQDKDDNMNQYDVMGDAEIHFDIATALSNGIKVGAHIELEGGTDMDTAMDTIDQSYAYVDSKYGKLYAGRHDGADVQLHIMAEDVGALGIQETDFTRWVNNSIGEEIGFDSSAIKTDKYLTKLTYITPKFSGFRAGVTYAAAGDGTHYDASVVRGDYDAFVVSALWEGASNKWNYGVSAGYGFNTSFGAGENVDQYSVGAKLGFESVTAKVGFKWLDLNDSGDGYVFDAGVVYENGPYALSASYLRGRSSDVGILEGTMLLSAKYNLAAGVDSFATFGMGKYKETGVVTNDGIAVVAGMMLSF